VSAYSDNGSIWERDYNALQVLKREAGEDVVAEAYELAKVRWDRMHGR